MLFLGLPLLCGGSFNRRFLQQIHRPYQLAGIFGGTAGGLSGLPILSSISGTPGRRAGTC